MQTPVLFIGFNRPDISQSVLQQLYACNVKKLYIALDGPREDCNEDILKCQQMRQNVELIEWANDKKLLIRDQNMGCGKSVSDAVTWFLSHEERGIIIEDDCLPHPDFFTFCEHMLERYAYTSEVWSIAGSSLISDNVTAKNSHFFSKNFNMWGWATWRRAWNGYCFNLSQRTRAEWRKIISDKTKHSIERIYWNKILEYLIDGLIDTWDFQAHFAAWSMNAGHIVSNINLVHNIGFRPDATHTKTPNNLLQKTTRSNPPPYEQISINNHQTYDSLGLWKLFHDADWIFSKYEPLLLEFKDSVISTMAPNNAKCTFLRFLENLKIFKQRISKC